MKPLTLRDEELLAILREALWPYPEEAPGYKEKLEKRFLAVIHGPGPYRKKPKK